MDERARIRNKKTLCIQCFTALTFLEHAFQEGDGRCDLATFGMTYQHGRTCYTHFTFPTRCTYLDTIARTADNLLGLTNTISMPRRSFGYHAQSWTDISLSGPWMSQERLFDGDDIGWYFVIHGGKGSGVRGRRKKLCLYVLAAAGRWRRECFVSVGILGWRWRRWWVGRVCANL